MAQMVYPVVKRKQPTLVTGSKQRGFTLLEIMVVLVIMATAASMVTWSLPGDGRVLRSETEQLAVQLRAARDLAVFSATDVQLSANTEQRLLTITQWGKQGWQVYDSYRFSGRAEHQIRHAERDELTVEWLNNGTLLTKSEQPLHWQLSLGEESRCLIAELDGKVWVKDAGC